MSWNTSVRRDILSSRVRSRIRKRRALWIQPDLSAQLDFLRRASNQYSEIAGGRRPILLANVVVREGAPIQFDGDRFRLPRLQINSAEALQFLYRPRDFRVGIAYINFANLGALPPSRVRNLERDADCLVGAEGRWRDFQVAVFEGRIGESIAKRKQRGYERWHARRLGA